MTAYASMAAEILRRVKANLSSGVKGASTGSLDREHMVAAVQRALAGRRRRVAFRRDAIRIGCVAAAAATLVVAGRIVSRSGAGAIAQHKTATKMASEPSVVTHPLSILESAPGAESARSGDSALVGDGVTSRSAKAGTRLQPGSRLLAPKTAEISLGSPEGTVLTLEAAGELAVLEQSSTRRFSLRKGAVRAQVARLQPGERFIIATEDAEVEVHGTVFRVSTVDPDMHCGDGSRTRVSVFEGVVSVRARGAEAFVPAGGVWPLCQETTATPAMVVGVAKPRSGILRRAASPPGAAASAAPIRTTSTGRLGTEGGTLSPMAETSGLAAANDLFAAAARAKRQHRDGDAIRLFSRLIELAPDGPLAEGAMAQRMKLLGRLDRGSARRAAAEYLARYPDGFARGDASRLAGPQP